MAEFTANALQTVTANGNVLFTDTVEQGCCCVRHREGSGTVTLRGGHRYLVAFSADLAGATADTSVSLSLAIAGEAVPATQMTATPSVANAFNNVATFMYVTVPSCCCYNVSVKNISTASVTVTNANLIIIKED